MILSIKRVGNSKITVAIGEDPNSPLRLFTLSLAEAESVADMLKLAVKADKFEFSIESK